MPEGPEIRRAADKIAAKLEGRVVDEVYFGLPRLEPFAEDLEVAHFVVHQKQPDLLPVCRCMAC